MADTEYKLREWRGGQVQAERLAAAILHIEGYSSVDPQSPLGGADGIKDVLCEKNGWKYVAAAYFPTTNKTFSEIKSKFEGDLEGVSKNSASGILFVTNQHLTLGERSSLEGIASKDGCNAILYHLERIRGLLDSPLGYGARLEFLSIGMSIEDQLSFFSRWNNSLDEKLHDQSLLIIRELSRKIELLSSPLSKLDAQMEDFSQFVTRTNSLVSKLIDASDKSKIPSPSSITATDTLTLEKLCMWHKALMIDMPNSTQAGLLRSSEVWIGPAGSHKKDATHVPPSPHEITELLNQLIKRWTDNFHVIRNADKQTKISEVARFHHELLRIHPFLDGNGRLARFLLTQQASELFGITHKVTLEDRRPYVDALRAADNGDRSALETEITQALFGVEFIAGSPCQMSGQNCPSCREGVMDVAGGETGVECANCGLFIPA